VLLLLVSGFGSFGGHSSFGTPNNQTSPMARSVRLKDMCHFAESCLGAISYDMVRVKRSPRVTASEKGVNFLF